VLKACLSAEVTSSILSLCDSMFQIFVVTEATLIYVVCKKK
jgi:hypothetical protein